MIRTRQQLDSMLERLEDNLPALMQESGEEGFPEAFAEQADRIATSACRADRDYVRGRITCMLASRGLIPGESEGEPCV